MQRMHCCYQELTIVTRYANAPATSTKRLQLLINMAARVLSSRSKFYHLTVLGDRISVIYADDTQIYI